MLLFKTMIPRPSLQFSTIQTSQPGNNLLVYTTVSKLDLHWYIQSAMIEWRKLCSKNLKMPIIREALLGWEVVLKLYFHLRYVLSWPAHYRTGRHGRRLALFYYQSHAHIHVQFVLDTTYDSAKGPIRPELILVSVAWSDMKYFYSIQDGMLVYYRFTPSIKFNQYPFTHLCGERLCKSKASCPS